MTESHQFKQERALTTLALAEHDLHAAGWHDDADKVGDMRLDILKRRKR